MGYAEFRARRAAKAAEAKARLFAPVERRPADVAREAELRARLAAAKAAPAAAAPPPVDLGAEGWEVTTKRWNMGLRRHRKAMHAMLADGWQVVSQSGIASNTVVVLRRPKH